MTTPSLPVEPIIGTSSGFESLIRRAKSARYVLLGEASHGTHEFYQCRSEITKRLIAECGFNAVAVEADWPDAYRINRFVRSESTDASALESLSDFRRFPQWMWRNAEVRDFVEWLLVHNDARPPAERVGFYGLDLYSMHASMEAVLRHLGQTDEAAALRARKRYACFDHFEENPQRYGYATSLGMVPACEEEALAQLLDLQQQRSQHLDREARDAHFFAEQNARLVSNAEQYYRMMFTEGARSWNYRDRHMAETLFALSEHLDRGREPPRVVVWAHNSHLGDARATDMHRRGELNLGQLVREHFADSSLLVGFTTHSGTVMAADDWDAPGRVKSVRLGLPESYESVMHAQSLANFYVDLDKSNDAVQQLMEPRLERAIGVVYRPETERQSHYFRARLPDQFDALIHFDITTAVRPL